MLCVKVVMLRFTNITLSNVRTTMTKSKHPLVRAGVDFGCLA
jgi:hypothetical protein